MTRKKQGRAPYGSQQKKVLTALLSVDHWLTCVDLSEKLNIDSKTVGSVLQCLTSAKDSMVVSYRRNNCELTKYAHKEKLQGEKFEGYTTPWHFATKVKLISGDLDIYNQRCKYTFTMKEAS